VDVIVTPVLPNIGIWTLRDRLGRHLGQLKQMPGGAFVISPRGELDKMHSITFPSLEAALEAIEKHMKGSCELMDPGQGKTWHSCCSISRQNREHTVADCLPPLAGALCLGRAISRVLVTSMHMSNPAPLARRKPPDGRRPPCVPHVRPNARKPVPPPA
jgi:hypothetical protein